MLLGAHLLGATRLTCCSIHTEAQAELELLLAVAYTQSLASVCKELLMQALCVERARAADLATAYTHRGAGSARAASLSLGQCRRGN